MTGLFDKHIEDTNTHEYYGNVALELEEIIKRTSFKPTFTFYKELAHTLTLKADIGVRLRTAYLDKDKEELAINADPRHMWRILDNLLGNICKYALEGTRVYVDVKQNEKQQVELVIKNISASQLHMSPEELTQRFVRGDPSRSTEGSGLGLSIARNLTMAQGGSFEVILDGDLFKVLLKFPRMS